jgi:hypothetical protein
VQQASGYVGSIRALEVTHGKNGWHPHLHVLLLLDGAAEHRAKALSVFLFERWKRIIGRLGFGRCTRDAFSFERMTSPEDAGLYAAKWGPDWELTHGHLKRAGAGGRTPWQILHDVQTSGLAQDARLFQVYAAAFKGARQLTWSRGLRQRYGLAEDSSDETLLQREECAFHTLGYVDAGAFYALHQRQAVAVALESIERAGWGGFLSLRATSRFSRTKGS